MLHLNNVFTFLRYEKHFLKYWSWITTAWNNATYIDVNACLTIKTSFKTLVEITEVNSLKSNLNIFTNCCVIKKMKLLRNVEFTFCLFLTKILIISLKNIKHLVCVIEANFLSSEVGSKCLSQYGRISSSKC